MGTITRTFANNITTSGVFKPTAFNNASFDNVTAVPGGAVEGGKYGFIINSNCKCKCFNKFHNWNRQYL
jgi:hypothetical protein